MPLVLADSFGVSDILGLVAALVGSALGLAMLVRLMAREGARVELLLELLPAPLGLVLRLVTDQKRRDHGPTFEDRVNEAANALRDASEIVTQLEQEIRARQEAVERLQREQKLLELSQEQVAAIQGALTKDVRRSTWIAVAAAAFFFLAGVGVTVLVSG